MAAAAVPLMKAVVRDAYGTPERLRVGEVERPAIAADGVLVRVQAASVNPFDWHILRGEPYLMRLSEGLRTPKALVLGGDVAGVVESVGENVTELRPGDEVFGSKYGSFAEYVAGRERNLAPKPARLSPAEAAALPGAGITALQALRDAGALRPGQRVLVNGAAGGVGTFAVQIAKALGGEVTGVCSTGNVDLVRSLGADHIVDYIVEDFARSGRRYDLIVDNVGNRALRDLSRCATADGTVVLVGGGGVSESRRRLLGPVARGLRAFVYKPFARPTIRLFLAKIRKDDLLALKELVDDGKMTPVIDRTYSLDEAADAVRYLETGHARGKVVIRLDRDDR
jgi:NADPH:quinone reductase-like Zn-dependent oxidoreductase